MPTSIDRDDPLRGHGGSGGLRLHPLTRPAEADALTALALAHGPVRGLVVGPAGSGKSAVLARLREALAARETTIIVAPGADASDDDGAVAIVDDADTLDEPDLRVLEQLASDPERSLVVAFRERAGARLDTVARRLERSGTLVLLGETSAPHLVHATRMPPACADAIVVQTGGLTWLTNVAVAAHEGTMRGGGEAEACDLDPSHQRLVTSLHGVISYRLSGLDPAVRAAVEVLCLVPRHRIGEAPPAGLTWDDAVLEGWSAGLLARSGDAPPLVRSAVRADLPAHRVPDLLAYAGVDSASELDDEPGDDHAAGGSPAERLFARGDRVRAADPVRAMVLYGEAMGAGATPAEFAMRFAVAAMGAGDLDTAGTCVDRVLRIDGHPATDAAVDASLALWAARGALRAGVAAHGGAATGDAVSLARRSLARLAVGLAPHADPADRVDVRAGGASRDDGDGSGGSASTDTLGVASTMLDASLRASLGHDVPESVDDIVLASELYSAARTDFPLVEPPAVVAAAAALSAGAPATAASALSAAVRASQGGHGARPRLLLWQAWISIAAGRPDEAGDRLRRARECGAVFHPRDRLIEAACETALARRYGNATTLEEAMHAAAPLLVAQRFDLFLHPFLAEFVLASGRVDAPSTVERVFAAEIASLEGAGAAPLWAVTLHWAGIQRGILRNRPDQLAPHARALLAAAAHNPHAARLADAGRVWTEVLAGKVDAERVEGVAHTLAHDGLTWDGARLCAHGAARSADRQASAQLLAAARELHPRTHAVGEGRALPEEIREERAVLSARESEVARLVVQGKTYVEIGQSLYISPRTAEHHIARIRRRLDATSRSDLIAKLRAALSDEDGRREGAA